MKASNKYLFDQEVDCLKCKHVSTSDYGHLVCKLNPNAMTVNNEEQYFSVHYARGVYSVYHLFYLPYFCGPLGKYYESK